MQTTLVSLLRCPNCDRSLGLDSNTDQHEIVDGALECASCRRTYPIVKGVPNFLPPELSASLSQTESSFSAKWNRIPEMYDADTSTTKHQYGWYLDRYKWKTEEKLRSFLQTKTLVLDAGCGLGRDIRWYATLNPKATVVGADLSEGALHAYARSRHLGNVSVIRGDLNKLPFADGAFDFVASDQVLSNVADTEHSIRSLWKLVKPGGHFAFYVYKRKAPIREFTDDLMRSAVIPLSPEQAWEACKPVTELGKALSDLNVSFTIPSDIPQLEMKAGTYNLQRFIYYKILKCFWNDTMTFDQNNLVNLDWFHPEFTHRYSPDQVRTWADQLGMQVEVLDTDDESGISVLARKPA